MANRDLTPWRGPSLDWPFQPFQSFRQEMDRLFDDFLAPAQGRTLADGNGGGLRPSVELKETDKSYMVTAELPGLDMKDIQIDLNENVLTISGEKKSEHEGQKGGVQYSERAYGRFERRIPFAQEIDAERVEATFKNGLLTVELPKNPRAQEKTHHIQIKAN